jgi:RHS repeat-associated protein
MGNLILDRTFNQRTWAYGLTALIALLVALLLTGPVQAQSINGKSGVAPQVISLPTGPGSLEGIGEAFEPDLSTGTARYSVNLTPPPGRAGFAPPLTLSYDGGQPNGPWGLAWKLSVPAIQRQTDKGLPTYDDGRDAFTYGDGEKLVRLDNGDYRTETEKSFMRFRRLDNGGWEAVTPGGIRYLFGESAAARETNSYGIFRWRLERQTDTHGNAIRYFYQRDSSNGSSYAYLREIRYNESSDGRYNAVQFSYEPRPDVFTERTSRAPLTLGWRCTRIDMVALGELVRAYRFDYAAPRPTGVHSLLTRITQLGADGVSSLPPTTFTYTEYDPTSYQTVALQNPPPLSLLNRDAELVDSNYDSLPDLIYTPAEGHRFYINRGAAVWQTNPEYPVASPGDRLSQSSTRLVDVTGNGNADFVVKASSAPGAFYYYGSAPGTNWEQRDRVTFGFNPAFDLNDPNLRWVDLNNDKRIDVMLATSNRYFIWLAQADNTWRATADVVVPALAVGSPLLFADAHVRLGDMTGDRLQDLVYLRDGQVVYFPHNGNGDYAAPVTMTNPPSELGLQAVNLQLEDLNNDGLDDLLLPGHRQLRYWLNRGDGAFSDGYLLSNTPAYDQATTALRLADMDGDGRLELLYSRYPAPVDQVWQYVDFSTSGQPNLLHSIDNGLGRTIVIDYKPSTVDYINAWAQNARWSTTLPFPVQVVGRVTVQEANGSAAAITSYVYRDGYYDGEQKEFRGFAQVERRQQGDANAPTTVTRYRYDLGQSAKSRKGLVLEMAVSGEHGACIGVVTDCYQREVNQLTTRLLAQNNQGQGVAHSYVAQVDTYLYETRTTPIQLRRVLTMDEYGNLTQEFNYGQVCGVDLTCGNDEVLKSSEYARNLDAWLVNRPSREQITDGAGHPIAESRYYYDGAAYSGLALGDVTRGDLTRQEAWLGAQDNRFIPVKRQAVDSYGNVIGLQDGNGNLTTVEYDALQQTFPVVERLHLGNHLGNDDFLTVIAAYQPGFGKLTAATDFNGNPTLFAYDTFGRLAKIARPGDTLALPTQQFIYNLGSPRSWIETLTRERSGEAATTRRITYFDGLGRALQTRRSGDNGQVVVEEIATFTARQSVHQQFQPYFADTFDYAAPPSTLPHSAAFYDPQGRAIRLENPDGSFSRTLFQPLAQSFYDEEDSAAASPHMDTPKTTRYDGLGRIVQVDETNRVTGQPITYTTTYAYNGLGNLTRILDAQGNVTSSSYDALGRRLTLDNPDQGLRRFAYDNAGNLLQSMDAKGQVIDYRYDAANRLLQELWRQPDGSQWPYVTHHYDHDRSPRYPDATNMLGRLTYSEDSVGARYFAYDARGNVVGNIRYFAAEKLDFVTRLAYDAQDRLVALTYPNGLTVNYNYNAQGLLAAIPGYLTQMDYSAADQPTLRQLANGVSTTYSYDNRLRLQRLQSNSATATLQDLTYTFDGVGNVTALRDGRTGRTPQNDLSQRYDYDALYRLTGVSGSYGQISYSYNSIHNLIRQTSNADPRLDLGDLVYGQNGAGPHALTSAAGQSYRYDGNGNRTSRNGVSYTWDYRNQLTSLTDGATTARYDYDAGGERLRQQISSGGVTTTTLYLGQYAEVRGGQLLNFIFAGDGRLAQVATPFDPARLIQGFTANYTYNPTAPPVTAWYLTDHLGSTNLLLDANGQVTSETVAYPYGLTRYESNSNALTYRFTGKALDASGLYYFGARYYDPLVNTWLSPDPILAQYFPTGKQDEQLPGFGGVFNPVNLGLYQYAGQNPVKYVDQNGEAIETAWDAFSLTLGIHSFVNNVRQGNYGEAAVDGLGILVDGATVLIPGVPGGAGAGIKAFRGVDEVAEVAKNINLPCRVNSFSAETLVATEYGLKHISDVEKGDLIYAYNEATGEIGLYLVTDEIAHLDTKIVTVVIDGETIYIIDPRNKTTC